MNAAPSDSETSAPRRIAVIRSSVRCFVYSLIGLVPGLGLPFAVAAIVRCRKLRATSGVEWNPAGGYVTAARRLAILGFLASVAAVVLVCFILPAIGPDLGWGASGSS
jgi:hypothetical protein